MFERKTNDETKMHCEKDKYYQKKLPFNPFIHDIFILLFFVFFGFLLCSFISSIVVICCCMTTVCMKGLIRFFSLFRFGNMSTVYLFLPGHSSAMQD